MARESSKSEVSKNPLSGKVESLHPKPQLGVMLKLEVARQMPEDRASTLDVAYALEEILGAV